MESPRTVSIFGSEEAQEDTEISLIQWSSNTSSTSLLISIVSTPSTTSYTQESSDEFGIDSINSRSTEFDDLSFPLPSRLLEKPPFFKPTWSISEYGELNGDEYDYVRGYPRFYMFGDTMMDLSFKSSEIGFGSLLRSEYEGKVEIVNRVKFTMSCV
jgi:hypothetical protein